MKINIIEENTIIFGDLKGGEAFVYEGEPFLAFDRRIRDFYSDEDEYVDESYNAVSLVTGQPAFFLLGEKIRLIDFEGVWSYV